MGILQKMFFYNEGSLRLINRVPHLANKLEVEETMEEKTVAQNYGLQLDSDKKMDFNRRKFQKKWSKFIQIQKRGCCNQINESRSPILVIYLRDLAE